ncbi:MAG: hypothetical protein RIR22_414 [Planctomycetota bacterium]|jgi:hypothetical protein
MLYLGITQAMASRYPKQINIRSLIKPYLPLFQ